MDHVRADDLVARPALPGEEPDRERPFQPAVRKLCLDKRGHGTVGHETLLADGGTEVLVLEQDLDGLVELVSIWQRLVASLRDLHRALDVVEASGGQYYPIVGVIVDRSAITVRGHWLIRFVFDRRCKESNREQLVTRPSQLLLDRRIIQY